MSNGIDKIYLINGIKVFERLMFLDFWVESELGRSDITHNYLYKLLDTADKVSTETKQGFVVITHGAIVITVYKKEDSTKA